MRKVINFVKSFAVGRLNQYLAGLIMGSHVKLYYKTRFDLWTVVHPQKLFDIIKTDTSCDAEIWMKKIDKLDPKLDIVLDVGANIGIVSAFFSRFSKAVWAFEPEEDNQGIFRENMELNLIANVELVPFAIGEKCGEVEFYKRSSFGHHSVNASHITHVENKVRVAMTTLDDFCSTKGINQVSLLKIDVEGSEIEVLRGFESYLSRQKVDMIIFEHAPVLLPKDQTFEVYDFLGEKGYSVFDFDSKFISRQQFLNNGQTDYMALPKTKRESLG